MAITLVLETGSGTDTTANTFATLAAAETYMESLLTGEITAWTAAADPDKNRALAQASRILSTQWAWKGERAQPATQPLAFPRLDLECDGVAIDSTVVPVQIFQATCELAKDLLTEGTYQTRPINTGGADQLKAVNVGDGAIEVEYQDQGEIEADNAVSPYIIHLVSCYGRFRGRGRFRAIKISR